MSGKMEKRFPPYQGREPYLYFCFSAADRKRVRPLLERMYARGTRVWYSIGKPRDLAERREREARMTGASISRRRRAGMWTSKTPPSIVRTAA